MAIEFTRDGPWDLPEGWVWARLDDLCTFIGRGRGPKYVEANGVPVINQRCIRWHSLQTEHVKYTALAAFQGVPKELVLERGDVLWNSTGSGTIGRATVYDGSLGKTTIDSHVTLVRPRAIMSKYLAYFIETIRVQRLVTEGNVGSTNQLELPRSFVQDLQIPVPPPDEQKRIVARIEELFTEIADGDAELTHARANLDSWHRALLKAALTGELSLTWREQSRQNQKGSSFAATLKDAVCDALADTNLSARIAREEDDTVDLAELPDLPESWCWSRIGEVGLVSGGLTKNQSRVGMDCVLPYLRVANVQYGRLDLADVRKIGILATEVDRVLLRANDLLIVEGNGSADQIGRCALWMGEIAPCVHQNHLIKVRFGEPGFAMWAHHWIMSPHGRQLITSVASSTSGLHTLSLSKIRAIPIPIPPEAELQHILKMLDANSDEVSTTETELRAGANTISPLRQSVLKSAFEGKLVAHDPQDEPADVMLARLNPPEQTPRKARARR